MVDAAIRSFAPIEPFVIRRDGPLWVADDAPVVTSEERQKAARKARTDAKLVETDERREAEIQANVGKVMVAIRSLLKEGKLATAKQVRALTGLSHAKVDTALARAESEGRIEHFKSEVPPSRKGPRTVDAYRIKSGGESK